MRASGLMTTPSGRPQGGVARLQWRYFVTWVRRRAEPLLAGWLARFLASASASASASACSCVRVSARVCVRARAGQLERILIFSFRFSSRAPNCRSRLANGVAA